MPSNYNTNNIDSSHHGNTSLQSIKFERFWKFSLGVPASSNVCVCDTVCTLFPSNPRAFDITIQVTIVAFPLASSQLLSYRGVS